MKVLLLESFYTSSHKLWADNLISHSTLEIELLSLPGRHWKWRMHHAGKYFAFEISKLKSAFDLILCSDMMNVAEFRGMLGALGSENSWFNQVPIATYFHENQITYPWSKEDPDPKLQRDNHYGWINYVTCLASDAVLFNSAFHKKAFINALPIFLNQFPNEHQDHFIDTIIKKSTVLPIGLELNALNRLNKTNNEAPIILWNHRWEFDKNPDLFFNILIDLKSNNYKFKLIVAGEKYKSYPGIFDTAKKELADRIIHFGYAKDRQSYLELLSRSDILPITSNQDFFGISAIEGIAAGCIPLLPKRLAFPEHLTNADASKYYYTSDEDLFEKIATRLNTNNPTSELTALRHDVLKYDIKNVIPRYDEFFKSIIAST